MTDKIRVLYNSGYGGFSFSQEALDEINKRLSEQGRENLRSVYSEDYPRYEPIYLEVYDLLGPSRFNGTHANIKTELVEEKYKEFISIDEYDGHETVQVNLDNCLLSQIRQVIKSNGLSDSEKLEKIKKLSEYDDD